MKTSAIAPPFTSPATIETATPVPAAAGPLDTPEARRASFVDGLARRPDAAVTIDGLNGERITLNRHQVTVWGGLKLNVMEAGPANGEAVVLLHGFPDDWHLWEKEIPYYLAAGKRVIVPDLVGAGDSDKPADTDRYRVASIANDVLSVLDTLHVDRFAVKGHDWGGLVSYFVQERAPERVIALSTNFGHPDVPQAIYSPFEMFTHGLQLSTRMWHHFAFRTPFIGDQVTKALLPVLIADHPDKAGVLARGEKNGALHPKMFEANSSWLFESGPHAGRVTVPTQVMISEGDLKYIFKEMASETQRFVDAPYEFVELGSRTHWFPRDVAEASATAFLRFVADKGARNRCSHLNGAA